MSIPASTTDNGCFTPFWSTCMGIRLSMSLAWAYDSSSSSTAWLQFLVDLTWIVFHIDNLYLLSDWYGLVMPCYAVAPTLCDPCMPAKKE